MYTYVYYKENLFKALMQFTSCTSMKSIPPPADS